MKDPEYGNLNHWFILSRKRHIFKEDSFEMEEKRKKAGHIPKKNREKIGKT